MGPVEYQHKVLGRRLWRIQRHICKAITTKHSVSIKGCHGSGKTFDADVDHFEDSFLPEPKVLRKNPAMRGVSLRLAND